MLSFRTAVIAALLLLSHTARADKESDARKLLLEGSTLFEKGELLRARTAFAAAQALVPERANPYRWLGLVDARLGRCEDAVLHLQSFLARSAPDDPRRPEVQATLDGCRPREQSAPPPPPRRSWAYRHRASLITGGLSIGAFAVLLGTGVAADRAFSAAGCDPTTLGCTNRGRLEDAKSLAIASYVSLGVGVALLATAIVLHVFEIKRPARFAASADGFGVKF